MSWTGKSRRVLYRPIVLVVDDCAVNASSVKMLLEARGFLVDVAEDGGSGVYAALGYTYAAIVMDLNMPVLDGLEATRSLRQGETSRRTPVIGLTGDSTPGLRRICTEAGMDDLLYKPANVRDLETSLNRLIDWGRFLRPTTRLPAAVLAGRAEATPTHRPVSTAREPVLVETGT